MQKNISIMFLRNKLYIYLIKRIVSDFNRNLNIDLKYRREILEMFGIIFKTTTLRLLTEYGESRHFLLKDRILKPF